MRRVGRADETPDAVVQRLQRLAHRASGQPCTARSHGGDKARASIRSRPKPTQAVCATAPSRVTIPKMFPKCSSVIVERDDCGRLFIARDVGRRSRSSDPARADSPREACRRARRTDPTPRCAPRDRAPRRAARRAPATSRARRHRLGIARPHVFVHAEHLHPRRHRPTARAGSSRT